MTKHTYIIFTEDEIYTKEAVGPYSAVLSVLQHLKITDQDPELFDKLSQILDFKEFIKVSNRFWSNSILSVVEVDGSTSFGRPEGAHVTNLIEKESKPNFENTLRPGELSEINSYTNREMDADEVFVFSIKLCDNEIDRDLDRFTESSLRTLSNLFLGKTGIIVRSHEKNPDKKNVKARILSCEVKDSGELNSLGEPLFVLTARAFLPINSDTKETIELINSRELNNASIGCSVRHITCSICKKSIYVCKHQKGKKYKGKLCFGEINRPVEAYEFSI